MVVRSRGEFQPPGHHHGRRRASIGNPSAGRQGIVLKRSFVAILVLLAAVVLVSPGIVGRLAERSMDEGLNQAARGSEGLVVTSQGFDRGWFSSAGTHRVELRDGPLRNLVLALAPAGTDAGGPVLVIDTRLDHGLIPVTSMSRDHGSLAPGLGSAVSTLSVEFPGGSIVPLPGTIYSKVSLAGTLQSRLVVDAGDSDENGVHVDWGDIEIELSAGLRDGGVRYSGTVAGAGANVGSSGEAARFATLRFEGTRRRGTHGVAVGELRLEMTSLSASGEGDGAAVGRLTVDTAIDDADTRLNGHARIGIGDIATGSGPASLDAVIRVEGVDAPALGALTRELKLAMADPENSAAIDGSAAQALLAAGFELHVERLDIGLPQGSIRSTLDAALSATDASRFSWTALLLALDAEINVSADAELVDLAVDANPQVGAAVALGYLKRQGDAYELRASVMNGRLLINGAPMQLPLDAFSP